MENELKYFVFAYRDSKGGGTYHSLAKDAQEAEKRLRSFLHRKRPFRKYAITLESVMPVMD